MGKIKKARQQIDPIKIEKKRASLIFLFTSFRFLFEYSKLTTGNKAWEIARVKKEGKRIKGKT